jgi:phosphatidylserine/phosphatidylglycerophosphate/cardiolipin synthase-like enzyme
MRFSYHRSTLFGVVLACAFTFGYFFIAGQKDTAVHSSAPALAVSGATSIQGPYFSDRGSISDRIIAAINRTRRTLDIAVYSVTQPEIAAAIQAAHRRGVQVRIVTDEEQALDRHSEISYLQTEGVPVRLSEGFHGERSLMHNKFAIFDGKLVETGSYNWTTSASSYNYENAIMIRNPQVSARYEEEFARIWAQAR